MTNAEKYLKDHIIYTGFANNLAEYIINSGRKITDKHDIEMETLYFLTEEAKPALTEDERVILEFIKNFDYIGRDNKGLYYKLHDEDNKNKTVAIYNLTTNLFEFIKERRRILY